MNRAQRRLLGDAKMLRHLEAVAYRQGVDAAVRAIEQTLREDFGFGDVRLQRIRDGVEKRLKRTGEH